MPKSLSTVAGWLNQLQPTLSTISFWGANGSGGFTVTERSMATYELSDGNDSVFGSNDAEAVYAHGGEDVLDLGGGDDWADGGAGLDLIFGGAGNDCLFGGIGKYDGDTLEGGSGNDFLDGGQGADVMVGGTGNDFFMVDNEDDDVWENADEGWDAVRASINYRLPENVEELRFELVHVGTAGFFGEGNNMANVIEGSAGDDFLKAWAGNDEIDGGAGADTLFGGSGDDVYVVDNAGDVVIEFANEGTDWVQAKTAAWTLADNVENLQGVPWAQAFIGTGNALNNMISGTGMGDLLMGLGGSDTLKGEQGNDTLIGGDGSDWLYGGTGADLMQGGAGNDMYMVDDAGDVVDESAASGGGGSVDQIHTTLPFGVAAAGTEYLIYSGSANFNGLGHDSYNLMVGQGGNDTLSGLAGDDELFGKGGNDLLDGGTGADTMWGGSGDDSYVVDNVADQVMEFAGAGIDTVKSALGGYTLPAEVEKLVFTNDAPHTGSGNTLANTITSGNGADLLYGMDGNDAVYGMGGSDKIWGGNGADTLDGGAGNDTLIGGAGNDKMNGGSGNDVFVFDAKGSGSDVITGFAKGSDKIDLRPLDGDLWLAGNQAMFFAGKGAFVGDGLASVRWTSEGANAHIWVDADGNGAADFDMLLMGVSAVSASDFFL